MPLRRRPPEASPRLRALLERAAAHDATAPDGSAADVPAESGVELWQPERAWIAATPSPAPDAQAHPEATRDARLPVPDRPRRTESPGAAATSAARGVVPGRHRRPRPPGPAWFAVPEALRGARLTPPRAAAAGLVLVVLVAGLVFGARVALARAGGEPRPIAPAPAQTGVLTRGSSTFATSTTSAGGGGPPTTGTEVTVHVVGQVAHPGVVRLLPGSRVGDAIARAGGALKGADLAAINLARVLVDGEQVRVPKPGEAIVAPAGPGAPGAASGGGTGSSAGGGGAGAPGGSTGVVDLNQATAAQLEDLPGVGPVLAQRIVDWRTEHGRFTTVDELNEVSGIGEKIFAELKPKVTV
ncbi:helix-hairpin-helix domain-containing protein [Pedococcus sp. NPDC057267]|uniref:helix-hairpin-helix domain-containing protein n=1 Tax=Pedococcus sp. NPDC057267 TaxID=3346077 RepID=UPI003632A759